MENFFDFFWHLFNDPLFTSFIVVGLGLMLGAVNIKGLTLGISGVFIAGLLFGLFGTTTPKYLMNYGLLTFIYVLGIQGGASFFNSISKKGIPYIMVTIVMITASIASALIFGKIFGLSDSDILGAYNGALNNASGLAILMENPTWNDTLLPSYGLVFPVGAVATVLAVQLIPLIVRKNPAVEFIHHQDKKDTKKNEKILMRKFVVENKELIGKTLKELNFRATTGATIERIRHNGKIIVPTADTILYEDDVIKINLNEDDIEKIHAIVGPETFDDLSDPTIGSIKIIMTNHELHQTDLTETGISRTYGVIVTKVERAGILFTPSQNFILELGDILTVTGKKRALRSVSKFIGKPGVTSPGLDLISMSIGCAVGIALGKINVPLPLLGDFTLGAAGGALFAGLFMGYMKRFGIFTNQISDTAKNVIKDIGLSFFLAGVGTSSGLALIGSNTSGMPAILALSIIILTITITAIFCYCYYIQKMDFIKSLACLSGGMFQSAAIATLTNAIRNDEPTAYFATCYPLATFGSIIAAQILSQILILT